MRARSARVACGLGLWLGLVLAAPVHAQKQHDPPQARTLYLIGDAGDEGEAFSAPVLRLLNEVAQADSTKEHTLLFLGDNIYDHGLHKKDAPERKQDEANINAQIAAAFAFPGRTIFIPGNHDWQQGARQGWKTEQREEDYVTDTLGKKAFLPHHGCPGPEVVQLGDRAVLVIIDTQWWLHKYKKPEGERDGCDVATDEDFLHALADVLKDHRGEHIIVAAHHPLYTYGNHGGHFALRDHLFPLTNFNKKLWVPLPVIGSIYPWYRGLIGNIQDVANVRYKELRQGIERLLKQYPGAVYVAGHEHNLQYLEREGIHHVVSGAGCKAAYLQRPNPLAFGARERGFARLTIGADGSLFLDFFTIANGHAPAWSQHIEGPPSDALLHLSDRPRPDLPDSVTVVPNEDLRASGAKALFFGKLYRDVWTAPIQVPVLRMDTAFGGLRAKGTGGGLQTRSLRLKAGNGHEYVARTIKKYPGLALSPEMRGTVVESVVADGIAGSHPYASVAIAPLADAVHVLHTSPKLVFIPDDPALGLYRDDFANTLCLLEERTSGDWSDTPALGASTELVSSADLIAALRRSHDDVVDDRALVRARLLDMLIGDWDRHDDQWRWASYKQPDGRTIYRPIPRDRDQAFFRQNGIIPNIVNRKWAIAKFQSYGPDIRDIDGQNFNARYLDRAYLTGLSWADWKAVADSMQVQLTDDVLQRAIHQLPDTAQRLMGDRVLTGLKGRRDKLEAIARRQYLRLARDVNVVGTAQNERFVVSRVDDERTRVQVWRKRKKAADDLVYDRTFLRSETKEVRLYGIDGNDDFAVQGHVRKALRVRIIEGAGKAEVIDSAEVKACGAHTIAYGTGGGKQADERWRLGRDARLVKNKRGDPVEYDRQEYAPDVLMPLVAFGYNKDDGFFLGGGVRWTKQGFKSEPFKWRHQFTASCALKTGAYRAVYKGQVNNVLGRVGFGVDAEVLAPDYRFNFFGFGNRSPYPAADAQFQYRLDLVDVQPYAVRVVNGIHRFQLGARWYTASQGKLSARLPGYGELHAQDDVDYLGGVFKYTLTNVDKLAEPTRGIRFEAQADVLSEVHTGRDVQGLKADLRMYIPLEFGRYRGVLAMRTAAQRRMDDIDPLTAVHIGGKEALRGFRRDRFAGNSAAYGNFELRSDLFSSHNGVLPFRLGLIALADVGRVWLDGADEGPFWHHAVGGGLFISPLNMVVVQGTYAVSDDDALVDVRLGFFF